MINFRTALIRASIVLIPSYVMAFLTEKMVYVVPMLAATSFFAAAVDITPASLRRRIDEDHSDHNDDFIDDVIDDVSNDT